MQIGNLIKTARIESGYEQGELAALLDISQKHLSQLENGHVYPRWQVLIKICEALQIDLKAEQFRNSYTLDLHLKD